MSFRVSIILLAIGAAVLILIKNSVLNMQYDFGFMLVGVLSIVECLFLVGIFAVLRARFNDSLKPFVDYHRSFRQQGVMDFPGESRVQATLIFTAVQGALQLGRAQGSATAKPVFTQIRQTLQPKEAVPA